MYQAIKLANQGKILIIKNLDPNVIGKSVLRNCPTEQIYLGKCVQSDRNTYPTLRKSVHLQFRAADTRMLYYSYIAICIFVTNYKYVARHNYMFLHLFIMAMLQI